MEAMITIPQSEYDQLRSENARLQATVQELTAKISLMEGGRDSRTSSTAPSHDLGRSNKISLRKPSGKKSGGQPGHTGHTLSLSDTPDEIIDHHPSVCVHCGEDLQVVDSNFFYPSSTSRYSPISSNLY